MTEQEVKEAFQELKDEGLEDEDLVKALGAMFEDDQIDKNQLEALLHELGYEFTPDFAKLEGEDAKSGLWKDDGDGDDLAEGVDEEEAEESGEKEAPEAPVEDKDDSKEDDKEESDDEDEKDKALKLMGL